MRRFFLGFVLSLVCSAAMAQQPQQQVKPPAPPDYQSRFAAAGQLLLACRSDSDVRIMALIDELSAAQREVERLSGELKRKDGG